MICGSFMMVRSYLATYVAFACAKFLPPAVVVFCWVCTVLSAEKIYIVNNV